MIIFEQSREAPLEFGSSAGVSFSGELSQIYESTKNLLYKYESGQIPYSFFEIGRKRKLHEIENSKEALADFIDNQIYSGDDKREILREKKDALGNKVNALKRENLLLIIWGLFFVLFCFWSF